LAMSETYMSCKLLERLEARVGIEPTHKGFADLSGLIGWDCTRLQVLVFSAWIAKLTHPMQLQIYRYSLQFSLQSIQPKHALKSCQNRRGGEPPCLVARRRPSPVRLEAPRPSPNFFEKFCCLELYQFEARSKR
jgi:hypothetical protein